MNARAGLAVVSMLLVAACGAAADTGSDTGASVTFALRPVGFQNAKAATYTAAAERCLKLPDVSGGAVTESSPAFYSLAASGDAIAPLRSCVTDIGADVVEVSGRPGEERGRAEFVEQCVRGEGDVEARFVGRQESQVREGAEGPVRVICRDRVVLDRTSDYQPDRLNIVVEQGVVEWAGRF